MKWLESVAQQLAGRRTSTQSQYVALLRKAAAEGELNAADAAKVTKLCEELGITPEKLGQHGAAIIQHVSAATEAEKLDGAKKRVAELAEESRRLIAEQNAALESFGVKFKDLEKREIAASGSLAAARGQQEIAERIEGEFPELFKL